MKALYFKKCSLNIDSIMSKTHHVGPRITACVTRWQRELDATPA